MDDDFQLYVDLGVVYEHENRLLEANDAFKTALRLAENVENQRIALQAVKRVKAKMDTYSYTKIDFAGSLNKVASIYCYGLSGTLFFQSLLDNHPDTIVTLLGWPQIELIWNKVEGVLMNKGIVDDYVMDTIFDQFFNEFNEGHVFDDHKLHGMCSMGENRDEIFLIDRSKFKNELIEIIDGAVEPIDHKFFYQAIQLAASYALGRTYNFQEGIPVIIDGGIHHGLPASQTEALLKCFPTAKLIHMIRNPVITLGSFIKFRLKIDEPNINDVLFQLSQLLYSIPITDSMIDRTVLVKLEDIHIDSQKTLQLVCECLNIAWNDSLTCSTFGGKKWWNILTSEVVSGFNRQIISKTHDDIFSSFDKYRLESLFRVKYNAWGYDTHQFYHFEMLNELFKHPFKFESLFAEDEKEYQINRKLLTKYLTRALSREEELGVEDRNEYKVRLLSPKE